MRRTDVMGFERPPVTDGNVLSRTMSFPDIVMMTPVHVPRTNLKRQSSVRDIDHAGTVYYARRPLPRYTGARTLPRMEYDVGPYAFPENLATRRAEDTTVFGMMPRTNYRIPRSAIAEAIGNGQYTIEKIPVRSDGTPLPDATTAYLNDTIRQTQRIAPYTRQTTLAAPLAQEMKALSAEQQADEELSKKMQARALAANPHLGYQRVLFTLTKYPALIMTMIALWNITGRGQGMPKTDSENGAYYTSLITAGIVLFSQLILSFHHHNSYKTAKALSYMYHMSMVLAFCAAVIVIVLASVNFKNYQNNETPTTCKYQNNAPCYTNGERTAYLAVLVGCSSLIILFAIDTFFYGASGLSRMKKRLRDEYAKVRRESTYLNSGFQY
ncbi:unnamed protein product [Cylicocyclus nassatus]|uniref:Uncharacterized protein n=1 Tax=Cylicocyclus nassatus TaxID=53992 RepID=A0AA36MBY1_CYLNA|nr:unnamed protein product [Cylicocyclus nassatus]